MNTLQTLRLYVKDIVDSLDSDHIYEKGNTHYPNAPEVHYLKHYIFLQRSLIQRIKSQIPTLKKIIITYDENMQLPICGEFAVDIKKETIQIAINDNLSFCWKRLVLLKELCHIYSDFDEQLNGTAIHSFTNSLGMMYNQSLKFQNELSKNVYSEHLDEEIFNMIFACELTIPFYHRSEISSIVNDIQSDTSPYNYYDIACSLLMPKFFIEDVYIKHGIIDVPKEMIDLWTGNA